MRKLVLLTVGLLAAQQWRAPVLSYLTVGTHRVSFETESGAAPFSSVRETLGGMPVGGEEGSAATPTICYSVMDPTVGATKGMVLVFFGDDEGNGTLTEFELAPADAEPDLNGKCSTLPLTAHDVSTDLGIRIGLTREDVEKKLGEPLREEKGKTIYQSIDVHVSAGGDDSGGTKVEVTSEINVTYRNGKVAAFGGGLTDANGDQASAP